MDAAGVGAIEAAPGFPSTRSLALWGVIGFPPPLPLSPQIQRK